ncbi:MAG TPA: hypothetical protein PLR60_16900 [Syntrophorhabdaceae bacterium]|nr:hypothetical protein [Syntrophorhabdaceae bacterium]
MGYTLVKKLTFSPVLASLLPVSLPRVSPVLVPVSLVQERVLPVLPLPSVEPVSEALQTDRIQSMKNLQKMRRLSSMRRASSSIFTSFHY